MAGMKPKSPPNVSVFPLEDESHLTDEELFDRAKQANEEMIPAEYVYRILDGENPVRVWREYRELSVKDLAAKAGISAAYLSQIEDGNREGSLATMKALAAALGLDLDDLV
jgi:ribosome-binding protein aMBF1 (putative translation factor)